VTVQTVDNFLNLPMILLFCGALAAGACCGGFAVHKSRSGGSVASGDAQNSNFITVGPQGGVHGYGDLGRLQALRRQARLAWSDDGDVVM